MDFKEKKMIIELIVENDPNIELRPIVSSSEWAKRFKRVIRDDEPTDYAKCDNCPSIVKFSSRIGTAGLIRHKCCNEYRDESVGEQKPQLITFNETKSQIKVKKENKVFKTDSIDKNDPNLMFKPIVSTSEWAKGFKRVIKEGEPTDYAKCDNCPAFVKFNSKFGTSGLKRHKCGNDYKNDSVVEPKPKQAKTSVDLKSNLTDSLVLMVAKDMKLFNIINSQGFQLLAQKLLDIGSKNRNIDLKTILPTDKSLINHIKPVYDRIKSKVIGVFNNIETFGIGCDHWTKTDTNYITFTVHYIKDCELKSRVLTTFPATDNSSSFDLNAILLEFNLNDKNRYFTIDNESAVVLDFNYEKWITCAAHNINLIHENSFDSLQEENNSNSITDLIKDCKKLVAYFKESSIQTVLKSKLKQSMSWDTTYTMLESIESNLSEIESISLINRKVSEIFVNIDDKILIELTAFLKPFHEMRLDLCKENKPTLHMVLPTKHKMLSLCMDSPNDSYYLKDLKTIYKTNIEKYFQISDYHKIATILYPSLKNSNRLFTYQERFEIIVKLSSMLGEMQSIDDQQNDSQEFISAVDLCLQELIEETDSTDANISDDELNSYLNESQCFASKSSIIQFWENNKIKYPRLYNLAIELLSIPATNLSIERNFGEADHSLTDHQSNLDQLLFIKSNFDLY